MKRQANLLARIAKHAFDNSEPIYILDTSAVIDLQEEDEEKLHELLNLPVPFLIPEGIMYEIGTHTRRPRYSHVVPPCTPLRRTGHWRKKVSDKTWDILHDLALKHNELLTQVQGHDKYSNHRLNGYWAGHATGTDKKDRLDIISNCDTHLLALGLTIAAEAETLGCQANYPVVLSSDCHIINAATLLRDQRRLDRGSDTGAYIVEDNYSRLIAIRTRP